VVPLTRCGLGSRRLAAGRYLHTPVSLMRYRKGGKLQKLALMSPSTDLRRVCEALDVLGASTRVWVLEYGVLT
jgi:hypothetical protein